MRVHPRIVLILSVAAFSVCRIGMAQPGGFGSLPSDGNNGGAFAPPGALPPGALPPGTISPGGSGYGAGYPGGGGFPGMENPYVGPPLVQPAGAWDPIAAGQNGGPGYHPDRQPWPHVSPFEDRFAEHTNEDGLWFFRRDNSDRKYFANLDYRFASYRRPDQTRVGFDTTANTPNLLPFGSFGFLPIDTGTLYDSFIGNGQSINTIAVKEQSLESDPTVNGFLLEWGFTDPTQNGFDFSVWYTPEAHMAYSRGFNPGRQEVINATNGRDGRPLTITNSLPIFDGTNVQLLTFDSFFGINFQSVGGGGDVNWKFTPIRQDSWYKIAPTAGFQAMYIGEDFSLEGVDTSGFRTFGGQGLGNTFSLIPGFDRSHLLRILSEVNSYLAGPQIGLKYEVGGENLKITGHSQVGVAMNREKITLSGFGVGDPFVDFNRSAGPNPLFSQDFRFREEQTHTRLSPTTSHEIMAQAKIFSLIPLINKIQFLEQAKFRIGYQINAAFEIQRPHRVIEYNGLPLIPAIRNDQETRWYVESYNFGVHWDY